MARSFVWMVRSACRRARAFPPEWKRSRSYFASNFIGPESLRDPGPILLQEAGMNHTHQVVIVGGGPVGLGLAIELGQRGIACCLVERYLQPRRIPKGQNLTQRTM